MTTAAYEAPAELAIIEHAPLTAATGVMPIVTPQEARAQMIAYTQLVNAVVLEEDYQTFKERGREKRFKKKSAVKKLQTYFGFRIEIEDVQRDDLGGGDFGFRVKARATSPNGRYVEAMAGCATTEERFDVRPNEWEKGEDDPKFLNRRRKALARAYHDVLSTAETRATNRAAMNLIGAGEVTAEEISRPSRDERPRDREAPPAAQAQVSTLELQRLAAACDIERLGDWLATHVAADLPDRKPRLLTAAESHKAKELLEEILAQIEPVAIEPVTDANRPSTRQKGMLFALHSERNHSDLDRKSLYMNLVGKESFNELTSVDVGKIIDHLTRSA